VVTSLSDTEVCIGDRTIPTRTVLWAAGVEASPLARSLGAPLDRAGRVVVNDDLTIPGHDDVFVVGDLAAVKYKDGLVPGVAPASSQDGDMSHVAGDFDVKLTPQEPIEGGIARMSIEKRFHGELDATSKGEMLAANTEVKGSAGYVAIERVTGTLAGRSGTFV